MRQDKAKRARYLESQGSGGTVVLGTDPGPLSMAYPVQGSAQSVSFLSLKTQVKKAFSYQTFHGRFCNLIGGLKGQQLRAFACDMVLLGLGLNTAEVGSERVTPVCLHEFFGSFFIDNSKRFL